MKKIALISIVLITGLVSSLWLGRFTISKYWYMRKFFQNSPAKAIKGKEKEFMEDRAILSRYELFYPSAGTHDAGPYLNDKIHWQVGDIAHRGSLVLPDFLHKEMNKDWVVKKPLFKKMGVNFSWMNDLKKFDYWSLEEKSPVYPEGKKYSTFSFPVPTYKDLITWAKLRYLYGKETGNVQSALKEVRHLMRLIFTNDSLLSSMVVVRMLKLENQFEEILTPKEMGDWKFMPEDHLMRAKRYLYSLPSVADIRIPDETFDKMIKTNIGICPMLFEGMMTYLSLRPFLKEELIYGYNRMDSVVKTSGCRKTILHKLWENPELHAFSVDETEIMGDKVTWEEIQKNQNLKASIGFQLGASTVPNYFQY